MGIPFRDASIEQLLDRHGELFGSLAPIQDVAPEHRPPADLVSLLKSRSNAMQAQLVATAEASAEALAGMTEQLATWMDERAIVRVLGAGRARLAVAIPANRLHHGGARVFIQDDMIPMPHSLHGGGIVAASASGKTRSVLDVLRQVRRSNAEIVVLGVAAADADEFHELCDISVRITPRRASGLSALADLEEFLIAELLDALVVAAGASLGYTDASWRLGHEDLGAATGPYDYRPGGSSP